MAPYDPFPPFSQLLREVLSDHLIPDTVTFMDMVAEDVAMEFPYAPEGGVSIVTGRDKLATYLNEVGNLVRLDETKLLAAFFARDQDVVIIEFEGYGHARNGGKKYSQRYVSIIEMKEGRIQRYKDYWNPAAFKPLIEMSEENE